MIVYNSAEIGKLIKEKRKKLGLKQSDVALASNVGIRFLSELENGKPTLEIDKVLKVIRMMGFDIFLEDRDK